MRNVTFNGKTLSEFGFYLADSNFMDGAAKNVETIYVPGRSGLLQRFNNYENVKLWANVYCLSNMQQNMTALRTFLESCIGYQRYEDDFNPNEYRMASFKEMFTPGTVDVNGGVVRLVFDAMPQRFLKSGETATDATPSSTTSSGSTVSVPNPSGLSSVSDLKVDINPVQDLNGQDSPYPPGGGKNGAVSVNYISATTQYSGVITAQYNLVGGKRYIISFMTPNTGATIYRQTPSNLGFDSLSAYSFTCDGKRKWMYGTAPADLTMESRRTIISKLKNDGIETGLCSDFMIEQVADDVTTPSDYEPYSNICPITGHTQAVVYRIGKNLLPNNWVQRTTNGVTFTPQPNGRVRVYGTATDYTTYSDSFVWTGDTGVYFFNGCPDGSATTYDTFIYDADAGQRARKRDGVTPCDSCYSGSQEVLLTKGTRYLYVIRVFAGQTMAQQLFAPMIRRSADDAYYDQYKGSEFTIDLNGTVYGGQVDFTTGEMTVDRAMETYDGSSDEKWILYVSSVRNSFRGQFASQKKETITPFEDMVTNSIPLARTSETASADDNRMTCRGTGYASKNLYVFAPPTIVADVTALREYLTQTPLQVVYPLAEPQTVQLTPTQVSLLQGSNYINASTGDVEITVSTPGMLLNPTLFESKPIIRMYGNGTVNIGNATITVANSPFDFVDLDCETMDAHYGSGNANPYVSLSTDDFITLKPGENYVTYSGFTVVRITPRWYEI